MYRGFNLSLDWYDEVYYEAGLKLFSGQKTIVESALNDFLADDNSINGSQMQSDWFPQIKADIFISHSHKNEKKAVALATWLREKFGLTAFIDSYVWGYGNDILRQIDNRYCLQPSGNYNYDLRNQSTSHVHMMLSTALAMMIDKTECLFFLNTPSSITTSQVVSQTESPWIYYELGITKLIRRKKPRRLLFENFDESTSGIDRTRFEKGLPTFKYDVDLSHLTEINDNSLTSWLTHYDQISSGNALDKLYELTS